MGRRGNENAFRLDELKGLVRHPWSPSVSSHPAHAKRTLGGNTRQQRKSHIYLQGQSSLVIGIRHPLLYGPGEDGAVLQIREGGRLGVLAGVPQERGTGLGCRAIRVPLHPRSPWWPARQTVARYQTWRRRPVLLHVWHGYHPRPAFRVLGIPPLFLRFFENSEYVTLLEGEVLLVVAREIEKGTDVFVFQALWGTPAGAGVDEGGESGLVDRLYQGGGIQVVDFVEFQQSGERNKLLVTNAEARVR